MTQRPHTLPALGQLKGFGDPRVHPNGFIQLDLNEANRLHVWHPGLTVRQKTFHPVHDHIFSLQSKVYSGRLVHVEYITDTPEPWFANIGGTHQRWTVSHLQTNEETILVPADKPACYLVANDTAVIQPGEGYTFPAFKLHETLAGEPTMTIMTKVMNDEADMHRGTNCVGASVMVPVGVEPDNDFNREAWDTDTLWKLIEEAYP